MCGIAGILRFSGPQPEVGEIAAMTSRLSHRGPDASDTLLLGTLALGHTRLAIIDLSEAGAQPMRSADGRLALTFNGEICNYKELRQELESQGAVFRSGSDTEVILHAYAHWGEGCVERFNGMFAYGLADFGRQRLFLARDHAGIKPLFYRQGRDYFAFASELSALREVRAPAPQGSLQSVDYFLRYQYVPAPLTIYRDTYKLLPAHVMAVDFSGRTEAPRRYWQLDFTPQPGENPQELQEALDSCLAAAARRWLVADVPVGIFLSGGMDSTTVALLASREASYPMQAFSIGFAAEGYSELEYARKAAQVLGLDFHGEVIEHSTLEVLPELIERHGEPFGDASAIPTWHVSALARRHVKTVLSGDGGDEAFGGYDRYFTWVNGGKWSRPRRRELWRDVRAGRIKGVRDALDALGMGPEAWSRFVYYVFYPQRVRLWRPEFRGVADTPCPLFAAAHARARSSPGMGYAQGMDFATYLPGAILPKVDIASMAHGLESRPLLLDRELLELVARLPDSMKYAGGRTGKLALRHTLESTFSREFLDRPKMGFGIPRSAWLSPGSLGWDMLGDLLLAERTSPLYDLFIPEEVERHIRMQEQGLDNSQHVWLLLVLALWLDQNRGMVFA